MPKTV
jgi:hypothetical protein